MKRTFFVIWFMSLMVAGFCQQHHWTPVQNFENTMDGCAVALIDGVEQYNANLELGVFCGEQCRGSVLPVEVNSRWYYYFTMGGVTGDVFTFRLYDHGAGKELDVSYDDELLFEDNAFLGGYFAPYELIFTTTTQPQPTGVVIELSEGWNWISNLLTTETSLEDALVNLTPAEGDIIKGQNSFRKYENGHWEGALNVLTPGKGYLYMREGEATSFTYPENESKGLRVLTISQEAVRANTASLQSEVMSDNHAQVIVRGVCWSTNPNPTVEGAHTTDGYGYGRFTSTLTDLAPNTTYYVRPYAMTLNGVCYGQSIELVTESMP